MFTIEDAKQYIADTAHTDDYDGTGDYLDCDCLWCTTYAMLIEIEETLADKAGYVNVQNAITRGCMVQYPYIY